MSWNFEEAVKAQKLAESKTLTEEYVGARKLALKAQRLYPDLPGINQLLLVLDVIRSAQDVGGVEAHWRRILQVDSSADEEAVKKQYRSLVLQLHPDKNKSVGSGLAFNIVKDAWAAFSIELERSMGSLPPKLQAETKPTTFSTICTHCSTPSNYPKILEGTNVKCFHCMLDFIAENTGKVSEDKDQNEEIPSASVWRLKGSLNGGTDAIELEDEESVELLYSVKVEQKKEGNHAMDMKSCTDSSIERPAKEEDDQAGAAEVGSSRQKRLKQRHNEPAKEVPVAAHSLDIKGIRCPRTNGGEGATQTLKEQVLAKLKRYVTKGFQFPNLQSVNIKEEKAVARNGDFTDETDDGSLIQLNLAFSFKLQSNNGSVARNQSDGEGDVEDNDQADVPCEVPDSDIFDFGKAKQEECFRTGQIWALYDNDHMPRYYARVLEVTSVRPFNVRVQWLYPADSVVKIVKSWLKNGFQYTCGEFKPGKRTYMQKTVSVFSHKMKYEVGQNGTLKIYPQMGDVWAVYKTWKPVSDECEPVEVVSLYNEDAGVEVVPLVQYAGFRSVFIRKEMQANWLIPKAELLRFSHQIPAYLLDGEEYIGLPDHCFDLDTAALL